MTDKEKLLLEQIKSDPEDFMFEMLFEYNTKGEIVAKKGITIKLMPDGIPMILDQVTADLLNGNSANDSFASVRKNKSFREISNEIAMSTPFGKDSLFYKNLDQEVAIDKILKPTGSGTLTYKIIQDYEGTKLINQFKEENLELKNSKGIDDNEVDFIIYAEKDDFTISLGRVLLIKMSDAMLVECLKDDKLIENCAKQVYLQQKAKKNKTFHFTEDEILKAFVTSKKTQTKLISDISVLDIENYLKSITDSISTFLHEDLKFLREHWDPMLKSDKYLFEKPDQAFVFFVNKCNDSIKKLNELKENLEFIASFNIAGFDFNTPFIESLIKAIDSKIKSIQQFKVWLIENKNDIKLKIPYICGIWNGLIEFVAGIIDMILLVINISISELSHDGINLETLQIRESIEEILEAILKNPMKIIDDAINSIKQYKYSRYDAPQLNQYQVQYNKGEDTILAIDIIITIITIIKGIAKLTKLLPKFTKWVDETLERNPRVAGKIDWLSPGFFKFGNDGKTFRNFLNLRQRVDDGWYNVLCHGEANRIIIDGRKFKAEDFAKKLLDEGYEKGKPIRLIACETGSKPNGFASQLAKLLETKVIAPTERVSIDDLGEFIHDKKGKFVEFNK